MSEWFRHKTDENESMFVEFPECSACTIGTMAGPIPGVLSNGERCDACERYASDEEVREALIGALTKKAYG